MKLLDQCHNVTPCVIDYNTSNNTREWCIYWYSSRFSRYRAFLPKQRQKENGHNEIQVICANNHSMDSVATTQLDIPELSTKAQTAYHLNEMVQPLLLIPNSTNLTKDDTVVTKDDNIILKGIRDKISTLWMIPSQKGKSISTRTHTSTNGTYSKQCIPSTINSKIDGISQCNDRVPTTVKTLCQAIVGWPQSPDWQAKQVGSTFYPYTYQQPWDTCTWLEKCVAFDEQSNQPLMTLWMRNWKRNHN